MCLSVLTKRSGLVTEGGGLLLCTLLDREIMETAKVNITLSLDWRVWIQTSCLLLFLGLWDAGDTLHSENNSLSIRKKSVLCYSNNTVIEFEQNQVWRVDPDWRPDTHQSHFITPLPSWTGKENVRSLR